MNRRRVAIFIFPEVEVLDFAGPFEVFSRTRLTPGLESRRSEETLPGLHGCRARRTSHCDGRARGRA